MGLALLAPGTVLGGRYIVGEMLSTGGMGAVYVVPIYDAGVDPDTDTRFIVMERLEGESLAQLLRREKQLAPSDAFTLLYQTASSIAI